MIRYRKYTLQPLNANGKGIRPRFKARLILFYLSLNSFFALLGSFQFLKLALVFAGEEFIK